VTTTPEQSNPTSRPQPSAEIDISSTLTPGGRATWAAVADLAAVLGIETWAIVGGQMVALHAIRAGVRFPRSTTDGDIVVDVRTFGRPAMNDVARWLAQAGFIMEMSPERVSRFVRGIAKIDLLAPDRLGSRPVTTSPPGRAVQAPGTTQALERCESVAVRFDADTVTVRCPSLIGALIAKAAATGIPATDDERLRHQQDLVLLLSIAATSNLRTLATSLTKKDRQRLGKAMAPLTANRLHRAWLAADNPSDSRIAASALLAEPKT
jgi:hypothetical protein